MTQVDIAALAKLARLEISSEEMQKLESEIPNIIAFVETIQKVTAASEAAAPAHRNVMRNDDNAHESGEYSERLLSAAPAQKNNRIIVKQVISRPKK